MALVGLTLIPELSVKLSPSKSLPQVNVWFSMQGSSPRTVEMEATSKLEAMLNRMRGVRKMSSTSGNGWGRINIEFDKYTDMDIARFEVSTIIRQTWQSLPDNVSYPSISQNKSDNEANKPFITYTINAPASPNDIQKYVEKNIKPKLAGIEGIFSIDVRGATPMEWQVVYDSKQLDTYELSVRDIQSAIGNYLNEEFLGLASIETSTDKKEWIRVSLGFKKKHDKGILNSVVIKSKEGVIIPLVKLAKISRIESQPQSYYRINGLNSIYLSITANENSNQLELSKIIKKSIANLQSNLPHGYETHLSYDATEYIKEELSKVYYRTGLTLIFLLVFVMITYRNLRYVLLIVSSLIANLGIAVILYYLLKLEIQLYSLAGIAISLTLIIDNIIVMSDQIIHRNNMKSFTAILAATVTTIASLSVIFFLEEKLRLNLQDFAAVVIVNLAVSLLVALFLVPAFLEKLRVAEGKTKQMHRKRKRVIIWMNRIYLVICSFMFRWRIAVIVFIILAFGLPVFMLPEKIEGEGKWETLYNETLGSDFYINDIKSYSDIALGGTLRLFVQNVYEGSYFGDKEETSLYITASLPSRSTIEEMNGLIQRMESYLSNFSEIKQFQTNINNARQASINILFTKESARSGFPFELKSKLISRSLELGGGSWSVYGFGDGFNNNVQERAGSNRVEMYGFNYEELYFLAEKFKAKLLKQRRIKEVLIESWFSWFKEDYEEFKFDIDNQRLIAENIHPYQLYSKLNNVFGNNINAGSIPTEDGSENIKLTSKQTGEYDLWSLSNVPISTNGSEYKLSDLATIEKAQMPKEVGKVNQQYRLCLQYEYIGAHKQGQKVLDDNIEEFREELPIGYSIENKYNEYSWDKNKKQYWLILLIFVLMYFISSILFNSLRQSFNMIIIIPISFIGIFLSFYLFEINFDHGGFASFILLSGLTINSNIYIIDEYNNIKVSYPKLSNMKIFIKALNAKIKPIILTALSTMLGFIPFLIGESGEAFWFPLAVGTIGGLFISVISTLLFLPMFMGVRRKTETEKYNITNL